MIVHVPDQLDELLSPAWLTAALQAKFPGIEVSAVEVRKVIRRVSIVAHFRIDCVGGMPEGLSPNLVVKGYFGAPAAVVRYVGAAEAYFYRDLAAVSGVRALRCVYADIDHDTRHGVVIFEDAIAAGGVFLDALSDYSPDNVADSLEQFAKLHAAAWQNQTYAHEPALAARFDHLARARPLEVLAANIEGPLGDQMAPELRDASRLYEAYPLVVAASATAAPWTVIHGDAHVGNILLDVVGRPTLVDWQLVQRGGWFMDIGYHLASTLSVEDRRTHETDLLHHYLACLTAGGVPAPTLDEARSLIGLGMIHGLFLWAITQMVASAVISTLLSRLSTAIADHHAYELLKGHP